MRRAVDLRLMIAAALPVAGLACPKHTGTVTPGAPSPWEEWVIFDQPLERLRRVLTKVLPAQIVIAIRRVRSKSLGLCALLRLASFSDLRREI